MKKVISLLCAAVLLLAACKGPESSKISLASVLTEGKIEGEITVSCFDTTIYKSFLDEAAAAFEAKYPGTKVNIESFASLPEIKTQEEDRKTMTLITKSGDNTQEKSDYTNKINTELMSGKGADILAIDILPYYKYAANGQLDNLREYMENDPDFNINDYRSNLFDAVTDDKGQYIIPVDYSFNYFAYDRSLFTESQQAPLKAAEKMNYEQIIELGKEAFEAKNQGGGEPTYMFGLNEIGAMRGSMFNELFSQNYSDFVDINAKKVNFTDGKFVSMLNSIKEYSASGYIKGGSGVMMAAGAGGNGNGGAKTGGKGGAITSDMFEQNISERYFFKSMSSTVLMQAFNKNSMFRMMTPGMGNTENDELSGIISNNKGEVSYSFTQAYGINSNSTNKRTAWEFIKFLLSDEMQTSMNLMNLPVNKNAFLEKTEMSITGELFMPENAGKELDEEGKKIYDAYVAQVEKYTNQINTYFIQDTTVEDTVSNEVKNFFDGAKTAEEVADVLQNKISLYLNE